MNKMNKLTMITVLIVLSVVTLIVLHKPKVEAPICEPIVKITAPSSYNYSCFEKDMPLIFEGKATSNNCGDVANKIKWISSKDGELGEGSKIVTNLSPGNHTVTAEIVYKDGIAKQTINVIVDKAITKSTAPQKEELVKIKDIDGDILIVNRLKGVVTDTSKGLMWQRKPESYQYSYTEAEAYAKNSKLAGYSDWRLPTQQELADIHNIYYDRRNAIISKEFSTFEGKFWSSTLITTPSGAKFMGGVSQQRTPTSFFISSFVNIALDGVIYIRLVRNM